MRIYDTISRTLRDAHCPPATARDALTQLEKRGGLTALHELAYRLERLVRVHELKGSADLAISTVWLNATREYVRGVSA